MSDLYMKNGDGFIVVYSITDATSLINTVEIFQSLLRVRQKYHFPLILVDNKLTISKIEKCQEAMVKNMQLNTIQYFVKHQRKIIFMSSRFIFEDIVKQIRAEGQLTPHQLEKERKR
ncbi:unnamed protein product [Cercopithifilaria johnstoni]|uniref:Uncharacterized protein n=1 Tax=Cercopithifilaria johnstoni TaxID=2874296 RepID=A0A8J2QAP3_9BILA|nr:unnamed protein product [Cercopithifilaria johnstoni]